jgi:hypothetical protein
MGWINMEWGVPQVLDASNSLLCEIMFVLDKVVEQIHVLKFPAWHKIESDPTMLSLETMFDFVAISWAIQVYKKMKQKV